MFLLEFVQFRDMLLVVLLDLELVLFFKFPNFLKPFTVGKLAAV